MKEEEEGRSARRSKDDKIWINPLLARIAILDVLRYIVGSHSEYQGILGRDEKVHELPTSGEARTLVIANEETI